MIACRFHKPQAISRSVIPALRDADKFMLAELGKWPYAEKRWFQRLPRDGAIFLNCTNHGLSFFNATFTPARRRSTCKNRQLIGCKCQLSGKVTVSIIAVIVLYRVAPLDSESVQSLLRAFKTRKPTDLSLRVLLFDNSPEASAAPSLFEDEVYLCNSDNGGLSPAYNAALQMAQQDGFDWLLTLDQDTSLPENFLELMNDLIAKIDEDPRVAAVVPRIEGNGRILSPYTFRRGALPVWFPKAYSGLSPMPTYALNSGSLLRVSVLRQVGGYDWRFWLDASDHAIFHALASYGKQVYVAGNIRVQHRLSLLDTQTPMSPKRYDNFLAAEAAFGDLYMNSLAGLNRNARLTARMIVQGLRGQQELWTISFRHLCARLLRSRNARLQTWQRGLTPRTQSLVLTGTSRPMISVCMATYNGERFIDEQIASILPQLQPSDELVIVDDASSDQTCERVIAFQDHRIKLTGQPRNLGVTATFEHAVRRATGDILFLCDGDDIWFSDKVDKVLQAFSTNPRAQVVCTGLSLIDESGKPLDSSAYMKNRDFTASLLSNIVRNRFQGSVMAFRSSLLAHVLPFPKERMFLHDAWIGMRNLMTGGETVYIDEPLLYYRRHQNNVSQRMGLVQQAVKRVQLVVALTSRWLRSR